MIYDLEKRTAALSVGEFAGFSLGPREMGAGGSAGIWRAQLGTHWHNELRTRATAEHAAAAEFEIPISGQVSHRGWTLTLTGRIDQLIRRDDMFTLREIKSVTRHLPADEAELRADYPEYFVQLATYGVLAPASTLVDPLAGGRATFRRELIFVETGSGLAQSVTLTPADDALFRTQLERFVEFLTLRLRARERLRGLQFHSAFAAPRPGQETTQVELAALFERQPLVLFEAPTGFGKTGVLLEFALGQLRAGHFDRVLYLTSKATGQIQVVRTLQGMTRAPDARAPASAEGTPVAVWHVRNKSEHCVNTTFHCVRDRCRFLADAATRWPQSGLARFYLDEKHARDLDTLRAAGRDALICPYEITRTALAFNDVWIGDYNYVFAPRNRGMFYEQPGFVAARTLLLVDEAHNLPARVADAYSHAFTAVEAYAVREELHRVRPAAQLAMAWDHWCHFLQHLPARDALPPADEDDARHLLAEIGRLVRSAPLDYGELGPQTAEALWAIPSLVDELETSSLPRLWWSPRGSELVLTCLDAAPAIGATLREFGGVVLASATLNPIDGYTAACGIDAMPLMAAPPPPAAPPRLGALNKRDTRKLFRQLTSGTELLRLDEAREAANPGLLRAHAPWRENSYDVAFDARVDTTFQHRSGHYTTTAATIAALQSSAKGAVAIFFPSYAYAEAIAREMSDAAPGVRVSLQPKLRDLAAQAAWVDESLLLGDALFLVLGSSFAESIDVLGGRVSHAMVVGPALPEVNAVQRARLTEATRSGLGRDAAFRRVYQIPGMIKVNQALGRLVRAPGQRARVILHCRRFLEVTYSSLLAPEYQEGTRLKNDGDLAAWLGGTGVSPV
jgi:Rad3-related DNA helicase